MHNRNRQEVCWILRGLLKRYLNIVANYYILWMIYHDFPNRIKNEKMHSQTKTIKWAVIKNKNSRNSKKKKKIPFMFRNQTLHLIFIFCFSIRSLLLVSGCSRHYSIHVKLAMKYQFQFGEDYIAFQWNFVCRIEWIKCYKSQNVILR